MRQRSAFRAPAQQDPEAIPRLALFWRTLTQEAQGYFEKLYTMYPQDVSRVLTGVVLAADGNHPTLASWVATAQNPQGGVDTSSLAFIAVIDLKVVPDNPPAGAAFAVTWSVSAEKGFRARKDLVRILDATNNQVAEKTIDQPVIGAGAIVPVRADLGALPAGSYQVSVVANVEGGESTPTRMGLQATMLASFFVGQTAESQRAEQMVKFDKAVGLVYTAVQMEALRTIDQTTIPPVMGAEYTILDDLAQAADDIATLNGMADALKTSLAAAAMWLRQSPRPDITAERLATLRGRVDSLRQVASLDTAGQYAKAFIEALQEQSGTIF